MLSLLAEAYSLDGRAEAGLKVLAAALELVNTRGLCLYEAEVHRLRGALLLAQHGPGQTTPATRVEEAACLQQALALAHSARHGRGSCGPPRASPGSGSSRAGLRTPAP
jgi:hypothetical protein